MSAKIRLPERALPIREELAQIEKEQEQIETIKARCDRKAHRIADMISWTGLAFLCAQWGMMVRLTYWEYSWDVMEPISYFVTFGTGKPYSWIVAERTLIISLHHDQALSDTFFCKFLGSTLG